MERGLPPLRAWGLDRVRDRHTAELIASNFGMLPVVKERGFLVGLVSEFDLLKVLMEGRDLDMVQAEDIMTRQITTVQEDTPVDEVIRLASTSSGCPSCWTAN